MLFRFLLPIALLYGYCRDIQSISLYGDVKHQCDNYQSIGKIFHLTPDLKIYQVGKGNKIGVILVYDIFGFNINKTRRFADLLSDNGINVVMPDIFRGNAWSLDNFPPRDPVKFSKWLAESGSYSIVEKDLDFVRTHLQRTGAQGKPNILGFCWGGKIAAQACQTDLYNCGISIHGSGITPELAEDIKVPMMFLPAGNDPSLDSVKKVLDTKPFGKDCVYRRFDNMKHGFASAMGNWSDTENREAILNAISMAENFLTKFNS